MGVTISPRETDSFKQTYSFCRIFDTKCRGCKLSGMGTVKSMNVDYVSVARERRLAALELLKCRQPALPGLAKIKMAPHPDDVKLTPCRKRIIYQLQAR